MIVSLTEAGIKLITNDNEELTRLYEDSYRDIWFIKDGDKYKKLYKDFVEDAAVSILSFQNSVRVAEAKLKSETKKVKMLEDKNDLMQAEIDYLVKKTYWQVRPPELSWPYLCKYIQKIWKDTHTNYKILAFNKETWKFYWLDWEIDVTGWKQIY